MHDSANATHQPRARSKLADDGFERRAVRADEIRHRAPSTAPTTARSSAPCAAAASSDCVTRCSSTWPRPARIVVSIARRLIQPPRIDRLDDLLDRRLALARHAHQPAMQPHGRRRCAASRRRTSPSIIGFISRGGPGSSAITRIAVLDPQPGRGAVRIREHRRAARHHAPGGDSPPASSSRATAKRRSIASTIAGSSSSGSPRCAATTSRVRSSSVGPRPPVRISDRDAARARARRARSARRGCRRRSP